MDKILCLLNGFIPEMADGSYVIKWFVDCQKVEPVDDKLKVINRNYQLINFRIEGEN